MYDGMPDDLKKVVDDISRKYSDWYLPEFWDRNQYESCRVWVQEIGGQIHMLIEQEYAEASAEMKVEILGARSLKDIARDDGSSDNERQRQTPHKPDIFFLKLWSGGFLKNEWFSQIMMQSMTRAFLPDTRGD